MAVDETTVKEQIITNLKWKVHEIEDLPFWRKSKANEPIAIAGGGPSIKYTIDTLRNFRTIIAAGSSHDWLIEHGVIPHYCLILDPEDVVLNYLKRAHPSCVYLIASSCHPKVFEALQDFAVVRWHAAGVDSEWYTEQFEKAGFINHEFKPLIGGGCTCGLRCISVASLMGFRNIHLFGLDSNLDMNDNSHHAYDFVDPTKEFLGDVIDFEIGHTGRKFRVAKYMMAQLQGLKDLIGVYYNHFDITVHGDSVAYEFMRMKRLMVEYKKKQDELKNV
jgi:hypothetical protein